MSDIPKTDQWKLDGICSKCRRQKYCAKQCRATKEGNLRQLRRYAGKLIPTMIFDEYREGNDRELHKLR